MEKQCMLEQKFSIPYWQEDDRPREKMMLKGRSALSDAELIAIIIGTGSGNKSAVDLGRELLSLTNGDLYEFGKLTRAQLSKVKGIGDSKAIAILAALELGRRRKEVITEKKIKIISSHAAYLQLKGYYQDLMHEESYVMYLDRSNQIIQIKHLSTGGQSGTYVDAKIVFKMGMELCASGMILSHNHPSGQLKPSEQDMKITNKIREFGEMIDLHLLDHLIITDNGYFSFSKENML